MTGKVDIHVECETDVFDICLKRTITCILGKSGTGKSLFVKLLKDYRDSSEELDEDEKADLDIKLNCRVPVIAITSIAEIKDIDEKADCVYVMDEDICGRLKRKSKSKTNRDAFIELSRKLIKHGDGSYPNAYFVFITRSLVKEGYSMESKLRFGTKYHYLEQRK